VIATDETVTRPSPDHSPNPTGSPITIQTPTFSTPALFESEVDERTSCCCRPCSRRWNRSITDAIITAISTSTIDELLANKRLLAQVKDNPKATRFVFERSLDFDVRKKLRAIKFILTKPEIANDTQVLAALQKITKKVFGKVQIKTKGLRASLVQAYSFYDAELEFTSKHGVTHETVVTKAVIHGYDLLRAFAPQDKLEELRRQFVYQVVYTVDQYNAKKEFKAIFGNKSLDQITHFLREKWEQEGLPLKDLVICINTPTEDAPFNDLTSGKKGILDLLPKSTL